MVQNAAHNNGRLEKEDLDNVHFGALRFREGQEILKSFENVRELEGWLKFKVWLDDERQKRCARYIPGILYSHLILCSLKTYLNLGLRHVQVTRNAAEVRQVIQLNRHVAGPPVAGAAAAGGEDSGVEDDI